MTVEYRTELLRESVPRYHISCNGSSTLDVVGSASGNIVQYQLLSNTAAEENYDLLLHVGLADEGAVLLGNMHGESACHSSRND